MPWRKDIAELDVLKMWTADGGENAEKAPTMRIIRNGARVFVSVAGREQSQEKLAFRGGASGEV